MQLFLQQWVRFCSKLDHSSWFYFFTQPSQLLLYNCVCWAGHCGDGIWHIQDPDLEVGNIQKGWMHISEELELDSNLFSLFRNHPEYGMCRFCGDTTFFGYWTGQVTGKSQKLSWDYVNRCKKVAEEFYPNGRIQSSEFSVKIQRIHCGFFPGLDSKPSI